MRFRRFQTSSEPVSTVVVSRLASSASDFRDVLEPTTTNRKNPSSTGPTANLGSFLCTTKPFHVRQPLVLLLAQGGSRMDPSSRAYRAPKTAPARHLSCARSCGTSGSWPPPRAWRPSCRCKTTTTCDRTTRCAHALPHTRSLVQIHPPSLPLAGPRTASDTPRFDQTHPRPSFGAFASMAEPR